MSIALEPKRPNEVRDYRHDWSLFLGDTDTIGTQTTTAVGCTVDSSEIEDGGQAVAFRLSGGATDTTATITQTIVTADGRTETEVFTLGIGSETALIVTLAEAKLYLRIDGADEDDTIDLMISAASDAVRDVATDWDGTGDVPDRLKLAVLARIHIAFDNRGSVEAGTGELPMLTPLRTLEV